MANRQSDLQICKEADRTLRRYHRRLISEAAEAVKLSKTLFGEKRVDKKKKPTVFELHPCFAMGHALYAVAFEDIGLWPIVEVHLESQHWMGGFKRKEKMNLATKLFVQTPYPYDKKVSNRLAGRLLKEEPCRGRKINKRPLSHWEQEAERVIVETLVRGAIGYGWQPGDGPNDERQSIIHMIAADRLMALAEAENSELVKELLVERDGCLEAISSIMGSYLDTTKPTGKRKEK